MAIEQMVKRDGSIVNFDRKKIMSAIFRAAHSVGGNDKTVAEKLSNEVIRVLEERGKLVPNVEEIQDVVEKVLIESGHAATAKAYILYRQKRAEIRDEKRKILEKSNIDEVDKVFDVNALRVLKSRYLRKSEDGKLIETPKQLFTRVATHTGLANVLYDARVFNMAAGAAHPADNFDPASNEGRYKIGKYSLNRYHLEAFKRVYDRANSEGRMKISWNKLLNMIENGEMDNHEADIENFCRVMTTKKFMPNTPAIANFGNVLGMGSACFHPDQLISAKDGAKKISEVKVGDEVLTHRGRFRKVKEIFIREANSLLSFDCRKLPNQTLLVTDEHPVFALKNGEAGWYPAYMLREGDNVALSYPIETKDVESIKVSDLVEGLMVKDGLCHYEYKGGKFDAFVHTTKQVKDDIEVDYDLMKVFGFYLSEGNVSESDCVRFTLSSDESDYCKDIISTIEKKFGITARIETNKDPERKWLSLRFHSTILAKFFENLFGTGYDKKKIPAWVMTLPVEKQKGLMSGMIRGDGTVFKNSTKMNARLVMSNTNLVYAFWQMCMRCGVFAALGKETMPKLARVQPVRCTLGTAKGQLLMNELFGQTLQETVGEEKTIVVNGVVFTEIEKIEKRDYNGVVFNLEVEEDHSYIANMVSVHNCFVLGIEDSIESIMESLKQAAVIFKSGGGLGYNFSKLRPEGDIVKSTSGIASGPLSFMRLFDTMTEVIKQGGIRRGANMGILNSNHPDIEKFIKAKEGNKALRNFNVSVLIMPDFWDYYEKNEPYPLVNPRSGEIMRTVNPRLLFDMIVYQAWESAEPGVIFFDHVNKYNPFFECLGPIVTTNPCVAADTLVSTERGLERIASIASENIIVDARTMPLENEATMQLGAVNVKLGKAFKTGYKKTYKLVTKSGYELTATEDHRIMTEKGWKNLKSLTQEDRVLIQSGAGKFNENPKLPFEVNNEIIGENGRNYELNLPTAWDHDLGLLMGWLVGDGFISDNTLGLVFSKEDEEAKQVIQPILEKYCNRAITPSKYENGCLQVRSASKFVVDFFTKLGVKASGEERRVPDSIFTATEEAVTGFLKGLFSSDGTIGMGSESRNYARLNSSSLKLLKDVQLLLLNLGIRSSIYDRFTTPKKFNYVKKSGAAVEYLTSGKNYELNISKKNLPKFLNGIGFLQKENAEKADELQSFEFYSENFVDNVKSVGYAGEREVWDINEPVTHSFVANGIVVHNCGEVLLYPNEPCNLGSINVWAFVKEKDGAVYYDWEDLRGTIRIATRFLDNVIDVNKWPTPEIEQMALATRKIGLGIMGLADLLYELRLAYNSEEGRKFMEKLMEFVNYHSKVESLELAKARGPMPYLDKSFYPGGRLPFAGFEDKNSWNLDWEKLVEQIKSHGVRNGYTTIIAPTGSISMIAGCSSGIEPVYTLAFEKNVAIGSFYYVDPAFEKIMREERLFDDQLIKDVAASGGTIQGVQYVPSVLKKTLVTAMDTKPEEHIRALAAFQRWVDSSISKTNNFPADATVENMRESYMLAYKLGCKDVTVFRDSSIKNQVLVAAKMEMPKRVAVETYGRAMENGNGVPAGGLKNCKECGTPLLKKEGCLSCPSCGWGFCTSA